jgi:hypothetical protein
MGALTGSAIMQPMRHLVIIWLSTLYVLGAGALAFAQDPVLPDGWRYPTPDETCLDGGSFKGNNQYLAASADFNGDERIDSVRILMRTDGSGIGLFVFLKSEGADRAILLDTVDDAKSATYMGISIVGAGTVKAACAKGYGPPCKSDELREVSFPFHAINFFTFEGANSYFYWDSKAGSFERVWSSD